MRIAEALRELLLAINDKAYRTGQDQDRVTEARAALEEYDRKPEAPEPVADQRAAFIEAMTWGTT